MMNGQSLRAIALYENKYKRPQLRACSHLNPHNPISAPRKCFAFSRSRAFVQCEPDFVSLYALSRSMRINTKDPSYEQARTEVFYIYSRTVLLVRVYSIIVATAPEPTVRPPSRIAKRRPCSIATLWISSTVISTLSPGMHISVPAGSSQTPVTSVVLK